MPTQKVYQIYGIKIISEFPFNSFLKTTNEVESYENSIACVSFSSESSTPITINPDEGKLIYSKRYESQGSAFTDVLYHFDTYDVWRFGGGADFHISQNQIKSYVWNPEFLPFVEHVFLGAILAYYLEKLGYPALHTSAVTYSDFTVACLAHSGHGKSTLATAFLRAGAALLTDDILPVQKNNGKFWALPGAPQINIQPDQAAYLVDSRVKKEVYTSKKDKFHFPIETFRKNAFSPTPCLLSCIYIPSRYSGLNRGDEIIISPLSPAEAVVELVRYSFIASAIFERLGWQARRLDFFAQLVKQVPVRRLLYPTGFEHLHRVTEAVLQDLQHVHKR